MKAFQITRVDGRSNAEVVIDLVKMGAPGEVYTYQQIADALSVGTDHAYGVSEVRTIVAGCYARLLKEQQRALHNVRRVGYRLAHANDHNRLALVRTKKADVQMRRGFETLTHVRWDEMDAEHRKVHEGTLLVVGALYQQQQAMDRRLSAVEAAIRGLKGGAALKE